MTLALFPDEPVTTPDEDIPELVDEPLRPFIPLPASGGQFVLRDYQMEAIEAVFAELQTQRSTLLVHATGLGKTVTSAEIAARWPD